jgi:hypothetical protein
MSMPQSFQCIDCQNDVPPSAERCPHCARPGLFPNVRAAEEPDQIRVLEQRYQVAKRKLARVMGKESLNELQIAITDSKAVIARSANELLRLSNSDKELYSTYYQWIESGIRLPSGEKWDVLRKVADSILFPGYEKHIRFAALSLGGTGLSNYGDCSITLRSEMIAHRTSVFEENSVLYMKHHNIEVWKSDRLALGHRATWENRVKLCLAKISKRPHQYVPGKPSSPLLVRQGRTSEEDDFIEVHIWGPMTIRTIEQVNFSPKKETPRQVIMKALKEKLSKAGVKVK